MSTDRKPALPKRDPLTGQFMSTKKKEKSAFVCKWAPFLLVVFSLLYLSVFVMLFLITTSLHHIEANHTYGPKSPYVPEPVTELSQPEPVVFESELIEVQEDVDRPLIKVIRGSEVSYE